RYINIKDGVRRSWSPPQQPGCRPLRVWFFGGSSLFGEGQRDLHTIPSMVARSAWDDGLPLQVENRGVMGDPHWIASRRFEAVVADAEPADLPDLVVFYDGANEVIPRIEANSRGTAAKDIYLSYLDTGLLRQIESLSGAAKGLMDNG